MKINEVASIVLVSFVVGYFALFLTGCHRIIGQGLEFRVGLAGYNSADENRGYSEKTEMELSGKDGKDLQIIINYPKNEN
jgi:hypothetical protein